MQSRAEKEPEDGLADPGAQREHVVFRPATAENVPLAHAMHEE